MTHTQSTNMNQQLSRRERQIMDALIEHGTLSAKGVKEHLPDAPGYSAVRALLARLLEKGCITFRQDGAKYLYSPALPEQMVQEGAVGRLLKTFFRGSRVSAIKALLDHDSEALSAREISDIERALDRIKKNALD